MAVIACFAGKEYRLANEAPISELKSGKTILDGFNPAKVVEFFRGAPKFEHYSGAYRFMEETMYEGEIMEDMIDFQHSFEDYSGRNQMAMKNPRSFRFGPFWLYRVKYVDDRQSINLRVYRNGKEWAGFTFYRYKKNEDRNHSGIEVSVKMGNFYRVFNIKSPF